MDDLDQRILDQLGGDARQSVTVMARRLHAARSTLQERIARLERIGAIPGVERTTSSIILTKLDR